MRLALREAERALEHDDVPIGAVMVREGEVLAAACNERELRNDPTAHAEILVLREAGQKLGGWRLPDSVLYVTIEPCAMCAGAIVWARVPRVVYGAPDPKAGAAGSVLNVLGEPRLNWQPEVAGRPARRRVRGAADELLRLAPLVLLGRDRLRRALQACTRRVTPGRSGAGTRACSPASSSGPGPARRRTSWSSRRSPTPCAAGARGAPS